MTYFIIFPPDLAGTGTPGTPARRTPSGIVPQTPMAAFPAPWTPGAAKGVGPGQAEFITLGITITGWTWMFMDVYGIYKYIWLVVWNMTFVFFHSAGN